jgi:hypothetical protein
MPQKHTQHSCVAHPMYAELYKCNSWESTFVEFCVDGINFFDENNFIDSQGLGRDSNPDPSALKPSECTTTPSTSFLSLLLKFWLKFSDEVRCSLIFYPSWVFFLGRINVYKNSSHSQMWSLLFSGHRPQAQMDFFQSAIKHLIA